MSGSRRSAWFSRTTRWTEDDARVALDAWKRSGLGAQAFARDHGITAQRLYWWRDRIAGRRLASLVPGKIVAAADDGEASQAHVVIRTAVTALEIAGASPSWIARLVRELAT